MDKSWFSTNKPIFTSSSPPGTRLFSPTACPKKRSLGHLSSRSICQIDRRRRRRRRRRRHPVCQRRAHNTNGLVGVIFFSSSSSTWLDGDDISRGGCFFFFFFPRGSPWSGPLSVTAGKEGDWHSSAGNEKSARRDFNILTVSLAHSDPSGMQRHSLT